MLDVVLDGCTIYRLLLVLTQRDVLYQKKKIRNSENLCWYFIPKAVISSSTFQSSDFATCFVCMWNADSYLEARKWITSVCQEASSKTFAPKKVEMSHSGRELLPVALLWTGMSLALTL